MSANELFQQGQQLPSTASMAPVSPDGPEPEFDEEAVSPEEQLQYNQFVLRAQDYISKSPGAVLKHMSNKKAPVFMNVGRTGLMLAQQIAKTAGAKGQPVGPDIMFHGGQEVVEMLMELGDAAGIWPFKKDSEQYDEAQAMAFMHGAELAGKQVLEGPDSEKHTEEAGNMLASQVAQEQQRGEVAPEFWQGLERQIGSKGLSEGEQLIKAGQAPVRG